MSAAIATPLTSRLGIRHPVLLAPMAGVSGGVLAAEVSRAGGLGLIGGGYGDRDWLLREFVAAGHARVGVGFILWALERRPDLLDLALDREPAAVFLSFGDFGRFAGRVTQAGIPLILQVQTLTQARAALDAGADILVAQGTEAGGHGGGRSTLPFVPAVVDLAGDVPVVAAGGIADGRGLAAALMLGASGALCGTAFYAAEESLAHPHAKAAAETAGGDDTTRGRVFDRARGLDWPQDWTLRARSNTFERTWRGREGAIGPDTRALFAAGMLAGDTDTLPVIVGEAVDLVRGVRPAGAILHDICATAADLLAAAARHLAPTPTGSHTTRR
jgi:nitronate monooxygenase